jgi:hypothetical protein
MDLDISSVAVWNFIGLNNPARRSSLCLFLSYFNVSVVCAREYKLRHVDSMIVSQTFGHAFDGFNYIPAEGD